MSQHPRLDLERWVREFPLSRVREFEIAKQIAYGHPSEDIEKFKQTTYHPWPPLLCNPQAVAVHEHVRRNVAAVHDLGTGVPVDWVLWGLGAPARPYLTKIGGVPHREAAKAWPKWIDDTPYSFLFQICFVDSMDLLPRKLPGDVLLCYQLQEDLEGEPDKEFYFEWSRIPLKKPMSSAQCPRPSFSPPQFYGVLHRTVEYPDSAHVFTKFGCYHGVDYACTLSTKIGAIGAGVQVDVRELEGDHFCTFTAVIPGEGPWPLVDCESLPGYKYDSSVQIGPYQLIMCDLGSLNFLSRSDGSVHMFDQLT